MTRAALVALAAALLFGPRAAEAVCTAEQLAGRLAVRCLQAHFTAINRCRRSGTPLRDCIAQVRSSACDQLPGACRPSAQIHAVLGTVFGAGPRDACRARMTRTTFKLLKRGLARARGGSLSRLSQDLATCTANALGRCDVVPALEAPCQGLPSREETAACLCGLALPILPASVAFVPGPCPSRFAGPACAIANADTCHEAFATGSDDFCVGVPSDRASYTPSGAGSSRAWSFPVRPRARGFYGPFPEATGAVSARSDGAGPPGGSVGATGDSHMRLAAPHLTSRLLVLRLFTGTLPQGSATRLHVTVGDRVLTDRTPAASAPAEEQLVALLSWQGDLDVSVSALASAARDRPVASADLAWRLAVLEPTADDDVDGVINARDPAPLDRNRPAPPPPSGRPRVLVVGLDGAGWDALDPLIDAGYLPTIGALVRGGARALLDETPSGPGCCYCPPVWSSQATGTHRSAHQMHSLDSEPFDRPAPAIWNVLAAHGGTSTQVSYRNTFPAEPGVTYNLSEPGLGAAAAEIFEAQQLFFTEDGYDPQRTWPPRLFESLGVLPPSGPRLKAWFPFAVDRVSADALARLAATSPTDLTMWILHSIDKSEHLMWGTVQYEIGGPIDVDALLTQAARWTGPITGGCCSLSVGYAWGNVASQYREAEQHVSRVLAATRYDYVLFASDHAMTRNVGPGLPGAHSTPPAFDGIFALSGPGIVPGRDLGTVSLLDVTPTLAYLLDLPVADDLPGDVVAGAFTEEHLAANPVRRVATWATP